MEDIKITNLTKSYGDHTVLMDFSLTIPAGKVTCIMGPSGCGKTTLLRILMGFEQADEGEITGMPERISAVFQEDRLVESLTVGSNLRMVLGELNEETDACLKGLDMYDEKIYKKTVATMSGGRQRRVALARALLAPGELLILDEPFKGLDDKLKDRVIEQTLHYAAGRTTVFVTHDRQEAGKMADLVVEME